MPSIASHSEENALPERPLTRRTLHAVPATTGIHAAVASPNETEASDAPTRRQVHRSTRATAAALPQQPQATSRRQQNADLYPARPHLGDEAPPAATRSSLRAPSADRPAPRATQTRATPTRTTTQVFNVEDYGPLSPESQTLTSSEAASPMALRQPTLSELMWLQEMRYHLRTPNEPALEVEQLSKTYNEYCTAWIGNPAHDRWDKTFAVTSIGIAIGDILVETCLNCNWMVSDTEQGPVFGVRNETARATYFPIDAVNRRWVAGKLDWIPGFIKNALSTEPA